MSGSEITALRESVGLTLDEFAQICELSSIELSSYEEGSGPIPGSMALLFRTMLGLLILPDPKVVQSKSADLARELSNKKGPDNPYRTLFSAGVASHVCSIVQDAYWKGYEKRCIELLPHH